MSILDIFRNSQSADQPVQQPQQPQHQPTNPGNIPNVPNLNSYQQAGTDPNGMVPDNAGSVTNVASQPQSPLDKYKDLWESKPNDKGELEPPKELTADSLQKAMANADFTSSLSPDTMSAIAQGGEGATKAFADAMNTIARQVMVQSTLVNNKLMAKEIAAAREAATSGIPDMLRQQATANHLKETNPLYSNPVIKPFIEDAQQQFLTKNPNATPAELTTMTKDLMAAISETFLPPAPIDPSKPVDTDWAKFLGN